VAKTGVVNRAAEKLHLTPQTLSGQLRHFEDRPSVALFRRRAGAWNSALRDSRESHAFLFRVGISDVAPKSVAFQMLAPALGLAEPVQLLCQEDRLDNGFWVNWVCTALTWS
jgi:LysR family transcriptional activator of nhaA